MLNVSSIHLIATLLLKLYFWGVPTGFEAAEDVLAILRPSALDEDAYAAHVAARVLPSGEVPVIDFVRFGNESQISDDFLRGRLGVSGLGQPLDVDKLWSAAGYRRLTSSCVRKSRGLLRVPKYCRCYCSSKISGLIRDIGGPLTSRQS